jgi:hypothetical protein
MNSSVWAVWAGRAVRKKKVDLRNFEQLLSVFFSTFCGQFFFFFFQSLKKLKK